MRNPSKVIRIPETLHRQLKVVAAMEGRTYTSVLIEAGNDFIAKKSKSPKAKK
ncbi:hypothetical protein ACFLYS_01685 [Chloroflexota bacterium]